MSGKTFLFHSDLKPLIILTNKYLFMKKLLLTAFTFLLSTAAAFASDVVETVTPTFSNMTNSNAYATGVLTLTAENGNKYEVKGFSNNNNSNESWKDSPMRCGSKSSAYTATISTGFLVLATVDKVEFSIFRIKALGTGNNPDKINSVKLIVSDTNNFTGENVKEYIADISNLPTTANTAGSITIEVTEPTPSKYYQIVIDLPKGSNNGWLAVTSINFYGELTADVIKAPAISCDDNNMVTITSSDAEASIYYTTNGDTPTTSSTKYNGPFQITEDTTIKAIAVKGTAISAVNTVSAVYVPTYANFADMKDGGADKVSKVTNLKVVYQNGQNLYLYDETNNGMLYFGNYASFAAGTTFTSVTGTYTLFGTNKTPEVTNATFVGQAEGTPVEPEEFSAEEASVDKRYKYVVMTDVAINNLSGQNFVFTDASGNIAGYNKFNLEEVAVGTGYTVVGIVDVYNNNPQVIPVSVTGGVVTEVVADPVITPAAGYVKAGTEVTITCETEGAKIYYTTDNVNPTAESTEYNGVFELTASCTVKAIAIKENCVNSKVVSAKYELLAEGEDVATYNFTTSGNAADLIDNSEVVPENGNTDANKNSLDGVSFVNGPITISVSKGEGTNLPRWWLKDGQTDFRAYNKNVITVKANQNGYKLVKIEFNGSQSGLNNNNLVPSVGTYANKVWTAPQEAAQADENASTPIVTTLTLTPSATMYVNYMNVFYAEDPDATTSAIDSIIVDGDEDAPVEYFNIQGVRVNADRLVPGLYIVRQGSKTFKVIVK